MKIDINVREKIAELANPDSYFICGNSDIIVHFDLDEEWNDYNIKTARFTFESGYTDKVFEGNELEAPIISNSQYVKIGIFAGNLHTTTPAFVRAKKSILCDSGQPAAPEDDVYAQLMEKFNQIEQGAKGDPGENGSDGKSAYQYAQDGGYTGTEEEFSQKLAEDTYSKEDIDTIMGGYVTDIASLIGGIEE